MDNVVSIMEHSIAHISHPSEAFLVQVETNVVRLMLSSYSTVIVQFVFIIILIIYLFLADVSAAQSMIGCCHDTVS